MHQAVLHSGRNNHVDKPKYQLSLEAPAATHKRELKKASKRKAGKADYQGSEIVGPHLAAVIPSVESSHQDQDQDIASISKALEKMK